MPRTHGYSHKGIRCYGTKDWQAKGRINVIGAMMGTALLCTALFQSNINSEVFHAWVTQELIPKSPKGAVVVMDNATFHKRKDTQEEIKKIRINFRVFTTI